MVRSFTAPLPPDVNEPGQNLLARLPYENPDLLRTCPEQDLVAKGGIAYCPASRVLPTIA